MYTNPGAMSQIARQHHHEMIADARQRGLLRDQDRRAPRTPITRLLAMAKVRVASARPA